MVNFFHRLFGSGKRQPRARPAQNTTLDIPMWVDREKRYLQRYMQKLRIASPDSDHELSKGNLSSLVEIVSFLEKSGYFTIENAVMKERDLGVLGPTTTQYRLQIATIDLPRRPDRTYDEMRVARVGSDEYRWIIKEGRFSGGNFDAPFA